MLVIILNVCKPVIMLFKLTQGYVNYISIKLEEKLKIKIIKTNQKKEQIELNQGVKKYLIGNEFLPGKRKKENKCISVD